MIEKVFKDLAKKLTKQHKKLTFKYRKETEQSNIINYTMKVTGESLTEFIVYRIRTNSVDKTINHIQYNINKHKNMLGEKVHLGMIKTICGMIDLMHLKATNHHIYKYNQYSRTTSYYIRDRNMSNLNEIWKEIDDQYFNMSDDVIELLSLEI